MDAKTSVCLKRKVLQHSTHCNSNPLLFLLSVKEAQYVQRLGIPSRLVIFPDENHVVLNPGNRSVTALGTKPILTPLYAASDGILKSCGGLISLLATENPSYITVI